MRLLIRLDANPCAVGHADNAGNEVLHDVWSQCVNRHHNRRLKSLGNAQHRIRRMTDYGTWQAMPSLSLRNVCAGPKALVSRVPLIASSALAHASQTVVLHRRVA